MRNLIDIMEMSVPQGTYYHGISGMRPIFDIRNCNPLTHFGSLLAAQQRIAITYQLDAQMMGKRVSLVNGKIFPVKLNITNALEIIDGKGILHHNYALVDMLHYDMKRITSDERSEIMKQNCSTESIVSVMSNYGFDGFYYKNAVEDRGHLSWVIFHPHQVTPDGETIRFVHAL